MSCLLEKTEHLLLIFWSASDARDGTRTSVPANSATRNVFLLKAPAPPNRCLFLDTSNITAYDPLILEVGTVFNLSDVSRLFNDTISGGLGVRAKAGASEALSEPTSAVARWAHPRTRRIRSSGRRETRGEDSKL